MMKKLGWIIGGLCLVLSAFGQHGINEKKDCDCPTCREQKASEKKYTLHGLEGLEEALGKKAHATPSADGECADHQTKAVDHEDHTGHNHGVEEAERTDQEGHNHASEGHDDHDHGAETTGHDDHAGHDPGDEEGGGIELSPEIADKIGLKLGSASGGLISSSVIFPAEIRLNRDRAASISPRYSSVVREVLVEIGDEVKKGDVLASLENRATLAVYTVFAPLDGIVVTRFISEGEAAGEDKILFEVADLSTVWADISIFPRFLHSIRKEMPVEFIAHDGHTASGTIKFISPLVSEETRTFTARCVLNGADKDFAPGAFVRARITTGSSSARVRVEREAVQRVEGETVVFVPSEHGFESRSVQIGKSEKHFVEITRGLEPGEAYVAKGAFSLKAEMITSGMDAHAGHGH